MSDLFAKFHAAEQDVQRARRDLFNALDRLADAHAVKRETDTAERRAKDALDGAELDADWTLTPPDVNGAGAKLLADDRKQWKKREMRRDPAVDAAATRLRSCEHDTAVSRDALTMADKRLSACRADLDASIATLNALREALPARKAD